jgi:serine/threonine protein kinase
LSIDWAEYLQSITDPLNVQSFRSIDEIRYKEVIGGTVGSGSFGTVYKANISWGRNAGDAVAVKQISDIYTSKSQDAVRKELGLLQRCNHPNVVKLLDAYQIDDYPDKFYLVMEPWAPYTLYTFLHQSDSQRVRDSPWFQQGSHRSERQMIQIFHGLTDGLSYLHDKSIKHKDLKPENILLYHDETRGVRPIIADLGISKIFKHGNPTDFNRSTYAYLAPEQVESTGSTLRSDVWQLGCCFALILAVFRHGTTGCRVLWDSFEHTGEDCSCNIALEAPTFMKTLRVLCGHGSPSQQRAHWLVTAMMEIDPNLRFDMETVKIELDDLLGA